NRRAGRRAAGRRSYRGHARRLRVERFRRVRVGSRRRGDRAQRRCVGDHHANERRRRTSCTSGARSVTFEARCPLVQWQDIGLWIREWWFESTGGNRRCRLPENLYIDYFARLRMDGLAVPSHGLKLLSGTANRPLAEEIARNLGIELCRVNLGRFADGEIAVRIDENVRGNDVFIVQPTNPPAENIMEL